MNSAKCPELKFSYMSNTDNIRWRTLASFAGSSFTDGAWTNVKTSFRFSEDHISSDNIFTLITINGPEPGIDVSLDDVKIHLAPANVFPDPTNICGNLIMNGDASLLDGFVAPMYPFLKSNDITLSDDGDGNKYFSIKNRKAPHDNLALEITPECLVSGSVYSFSMKLKVDSDSDVIARVITKSHTTTASNPDSPPKFDIVATCPPSSNSIGWVTCLNDFAFKQHHYNASKVELLVYLKDDSTSDVHYDDMSFTFGHGVPGGMSPKGKALVEACYNPGTELVLPSETLMYDSTTLTTIESMESDGSFTTAESPPIMPTSESANPDAPAEIAFLSRNIVFKNGDDSTVGPSLTVLSSPDIPQKIQGVEFDSFGTEGVAGRHVRVSVHELYHFSYSSWFCYACTDTNSSFERHHYSPSVSKVVEIQQAVLLQKMQFVLRKIVALIFILLIIS